MTTATLLPALSDYLVSARALMEYRGMFRLTNDELRGGPILDCPGGAASFAAEVRRLGGNVVSVDPMYRLQPRDLARRARADLERAVQVSADAPQLFSWTFFRSIEHHRQVRSDACDIFTVDYEDERSHYLPAALPRLPFADGAFALTLSSHLLFVYDDRIDAEATLAALRELVRVTAEDGEVRVFPLVSARGGRSALVEPVLAALRKEGLDLRLERVWYEAQRGGNELLRIRRG